MTPLHRLVLLRQLSPHLVTARHLRRAAGLQSTGWNELLEHCELAACRNTLNAIAESKSYAELRRWCESSGTRISAWGEPDYPRRLVGWPEAPMVLWYRGRPAWNDEHGFISIVGSRNPSAISIEWMNWQLRRFLRETPVGVVSGGARGIDFRAHLLAMETGRPTVALMPVGRSDAPVSAGIPAP
jgi:predicted Rossmann fold nucleotide-binding protein DprA/Smf involved in DNA uptake